MKTKNEHRVLRNLVRRRQESEYGAMEADPRPKSWSAAHPAYEGMNMGSRHKGRENHDCDTECTAYCD